MGFLKNLFGGEPKPGKPVPVTDDSFQEEVLNSEIPVVVDFWSRRCPPCQVMGGLLDEIGPDYNGKVRIFKLNVDENPVMTQRFGIRGVPTIIFFRNGKPVDVIVGLLPLIPLRQKLDRLTSTQ